MSTKPSPDHPTTQEAADLLGIDHGHVHAAAGGSETVAPATVIGLSLSHGTRPHRDVVDDLVEHATSKNPEAAAEIAADVEQAARDAHADQQRRSTLHTSGGL